MAEEKTTPIVEMRGIGKAFGAVQALKDVDLYLMPGEILGLVVYGHHDRKHGSVGHLAKLSRGTRTGNRPAWPPLWRNG